MASMNAFKTDAYGMTSLSRAVDKMDYKPSLLGELGLFQPRPVSTRDIFVEKRNTTLSLVPTSAIGAPPRNEPKDKRSATTLRTVRLADAFTMYAEEVTGIRGFNSENEMQNLQAEYARRAAIVRQNMELTMEHHRLGALQGILLDSDNTTVLYNYFTEFGVAAPAEIAFDLGNAATDVRQKCKDVVRAMARSSRGAYTPQTQTHALCGDSFYDELINHPNVEKFYLNWTAAEALRTSGNPFEAFTFGGITFHNYRGTDDNTTVAVPTTKAKFFPVNANGVFDAVWGPGEFGPYVNMPGQEIIAMNLMDPSGREAFVTHEQYSYPLFMCVQPEVLRTAREGA
jgi:hypothetical protein